MRGEIVGGVTLPGPRDRDAHGLEARVPRDLCAPRWSTSCRCLGDIKILRQWAGPYDISPDGNPIVGEAPGLPGFFLAAASSATAS